MKAIMMENVWFNDRKYKKGEVYDLPREVYNAIYPSAKYIGFNLNHLSEKLKLNVDYFKFFSYPLDGYGRLNRFIKDNFEFNEQSNWVLYVSTPMILTLINNQHRNKKKVVLTMFESNKLPENWVTLLNRHADAILVPSQFCIDVFKKSGVEKPIYKLPLFYISKNVPLKTHDKFIFGHQNSLVMGHQKGDDIVFRVFKKVFKDNKDVLLLLKGRNHHYQALDHNFIHMATKEPNVRVIQSDFSDEEIYNEFYCLLDCFVFPSRGEGFGIPPLEAMNLGIPTITTNGHSIKEYAKLAIPVKTKGKCDSYYVGRCADDVKKGWLAIDENDLAKKMWSVYKRHKYYKQKAQDNIEIVRQLYSPEAFIKNLQLILNTL